ncbi:MAG: hypothetical protein NXH78_16065 [Hyphomonadaceae bacterium]|nr:hypothetical protein [Hyphomonadaceae bacterium]
MGDTSMARTDLMDRFVELIGHKAERLLTQAQCATLLSSIRRSFTSSAT